MEPHIKHQRHSPVVGKRSARQGGELWQSFWKQAGLHDCTAQFAPSAQRNICSHWHEFFFQQKAASTIVDLGTGKGAVLDHARRAFADKKDVTLIGVDIVPQLPSESGFMRYHGSVNLGELPFAYQSADLVVSQFGLEYGGLLEAVAEAGRICSGHLLALVHAREGAVYRQTLEQVMQVDWLMKEMRLQSELEEAIVAHRSLRPTALEREIAARTHDAGNTLVLEGTVAFVAALRNGAGSPASNVGRVGNFVEQLVEHGERMRLMIEAAPSLAALVDAAEILRFKGFDVAVEDCTASGHLVGRWIKARRVSC